MSDSHKEKNFRKYLIEYTAIFMRDYYKVWENISRLDKDVESKMSDSVALSYDFQGTLYNKPKEKSLIPLSPETNEKIKKLKSCLPRLEHYLFMFMARDLSEETRYNMYMRQPFSKVMDYISTHGKEFEAFVNHLRPKRLKLNKTALENRRPKKETDKSPKQLWIKKMKKRYSGGIFRSSVASAFGTKFEGRSIFTEGSFSSGGNSMAQSGFGALQQIPQKSSGFGAAPSFGGSSSFGDVPIFGSPSFGGSSSFGDVPSFRSPSFGSLNALSSVSSSSQPSSNFSNFKSQGRMRL